MKAAWLLAPGISLAAAQGPAVVLMPTVEWQVAGEEVWPQQGVLPPEAILRLSLEAARYEVKLPRRANAACFQEQCAYRAANRAGAGKTLLSALVREDSLVTLKLALYDTATQEVRSIRVTWSESPESPRLNRLREAADALLAGRGPIEGGRFSEIPWLRARPEPAGKPVLKWAAPVLGAAALAAAWLEGHFQGDRVPMRPSQPLLPAAEGLSFLPGLFSGFAPPTAQAGRGGAGLALAVGAEADLVSPAGIASTRRPEMILLRSSLPDGTPEFQAAFVAPAGPGFAQGYSLRYRGDGLADEAVLATTWAMDFGWYHPYLIGMQAGVSAKIFLGQVGREGEGEERSRGQSRGAGLDIGLKARLMRGMVAAAVLEDVASYLRHSNDFTDQDYAEIRPMRLHLGVGLRPAENLWLTVDGRKGIYADQGDAVQVGLERSVLQVLRLRTGLQEVFGKETVRKVTAGFGLRNDGFEHLFGRRRLAVDYAFEFGLDEAGMLAGGHRFGLIASF